MEQEDSEEIPNTPEQRVSRERSHRRSRHAQQRLEEGRRIFAEEQQWHNIALYNKSRLENSVTQANHTLIEVA
jgi:hypothetical protein